MTDVVYKYQVYCTTESTWVSIWDTETPTTCPNNNGHSIDTGATYISDQVEQAEVSVKEEQTKTGGHFMATTAVFTAAANTVTSHTLSFDYPISALMMDFVTKAEHEGDCVEVAVGKDTITGALTANVSPGSAWTSQNYTAGAIVTYSGSTYTCTLNTVSSEVPTNTVYWQKGFRLPVSQTVIDNTAIGYYVKLYDGTNTDDMGVVIKRDTANSYIYTKNNSVNSFLAATPTYVQQTIYTMKDYVIGPAWENDIGQSKIGGSYVPAGVGITVLYDNKHPIDAKTFVGRVEYLY